MKMQLEIVLCVFCASAFASAWILPDRCRNTEDAQMSHSAAAPKVNAEMVYDIRKFAAELNQRINETYKEYKFIGFPTDYVESENGSQEMSMLTPYDCKFSTEPTLIGHVECHDTHDSSLWCNLLHTVSSRDTFAASREYKWGTKPAPKSLPKKIFEVGRENSTEEAYSCRLTKEGMPTQLVGCSAQMKYNREQFAGASLKLYSVKTDLMCDVGHITTMDEKRGDVYDVESDLDTFSKAEKEELANSALVRHACLGNEAPTADCSMNIIDPNKISDCLMWKLLANFPHYNFYTDSVRSGELYTVEIEYKTWDVLSKEYSEIIPFTKEDGNAAYQYVCVFTPSEIPYEEKLKRRQDSIHGFIFVMILIIVLIIFCLLK